MNIQNANTEPFYRLHRFHEEFNRCMRVAFGSIASLRDNADEASKLVVLPTGGEPWGTETKWREVKKVLSESTQFLSQVALVRVLSAFEDFITKVEAEHDRYLSLCDPAYNSKPQDESEKLSTIARLERACKRLDGNDADLTGIQPLLEYFVIIRNCVVHRSGRASTELLDHANSQRFGMSYDAWRTPRGKKLPALPPLVLHREIEMLPRHSVLASDLFHRAGAIVNSWLISVLGEKGFVYMAAFHSLLGDDRLPTNAFRSPAHVVNNALFGRYLVLEASAGDATRMLKEMKKWDLCRRKFRQIYELDGN